MNKAWLLADHKGPSRQVWLVPRSGHSHYRGALLHTYTSAHKYAHKRLHSPEAGCYTSGSSPAAFGRHSALLPWRRGTAGMAERATGLRRAPISERAMTWPSGCTTSKGCSSFQHKLRAAADFKSARRDVAFDAEGTCPRVEIGLACEQHRPGHVDCMDNWPACCNTIRSACELGKAVKKGACMRDVLACRSEQHRAACQSILL